jgi:hypothetical protein
MQKVEPTLSGYDVQEGFVKDGWFVENGNKKGWQ